MSKGFLVIAQNTETVDYLKQAYLLALSIKATQQTVSNISVITDQDVPEEYKHAFDKIIDIPWGDLAKNPLWKVENRWKFIHVSPYDETIVLDVDMLVLNDLSDWWRYCENSDVKFCSKVKNYKNEIIEQDLYHRKAFINNNLPNPYFGLHYFKKTEFAFEFYKVLEFVVKNWQPLYQQFAPKNYQDWLSMDLATAITISLMDVEDRVIDSLSPLEFVHMKPALQGWSPIPVCWQDIVHNFFDAKGRLIIGNHKQQNILHYVEKDFASDKLISYYKERLGL